MKEDRFEVELSFDNILEKLVIPFNAVKGFLDPSVQFGLQFEVVTVETPVDTEGKLEKPAPGKAKPELEGAETGGPSDEPPKDGPKIISLDSFRKK